MGEIRAGEGLFGLRRAFQIAGAQTVIMSLWPVEDATADAVRNASRRMITSLKRSGLPAHPYYWAAFVAAGDWR